MQPLIIEYCMSELTNDHMKEPVYSAKCNLFGKTLSHEIQAIFVKRYALKRSRNIGTVNIARKLRQNGTIWIHQRVAKFILTLSSLYDVSVKSINCEVSMLQYFIFPIFNVIINPNDYI